MPSSCDIRGRHDTHAGLEPHDLYAGAMADVSMSDAGVTLRLTRLERLYALRDGFTIPWDHIERAEYVSDPWLSARGWRVIAGVPGLYLLGTMRHRNGKDFVAIYLRRPGVVLELRDEPYRQVVLSADAKTARAIVARVTT
jgi:hypothetical protein